MLTNLTNLQHVYANAPFMQLPFFPNKYVIPARSLSPESCISTTCLRISSSITSQINSLSSSLSFHARGSKCQNSCNASNLCFFYDQLPAQKYGDLLGIFGFELRCGEESHF